jgi:hypothetical protein
MKNPALLLACILFVTSFAFSQTGMKDAALVAQPASVDLGGRNVRIPAPDNFTDTMTQFPRIAGRLIASESPLNEVLAVHVADEILPRLKNGDDPDLPFYTKVSVLRQLRNADMETAEFQALAAEFEKQSPGMLQSIVKSGEKGTDERLSKYWGGETNLKIGETRTLGHFDIQPRSISSMFIMNLEIFDRPMLILGSMSLIHVNKRLLFLYVFRLPTTGNDQNIVAEFTRSWTAKIVAAN